jgi:Tol biopolymer transport system component/DNA-binding winged helix-turn-helix (wHTH) protein
VATQANTTQPWRFGVFEVDPSRQELRRDGTPIRMREQSFRILVYLLEHAGEIVTREQLRAVLWPSDTFVAFDHSLNTAVMKLRDALGDSADTPLYIETIPKRGYRFIAPVSQPVDARNGLANANAAPSLVREASEPVAAPLLISPEVSAPPRRFHRPTALIALLLLLLVSTATVLFVRKAHRPVLPADQTPAASVVRIVPVTTAAGDAISPAFSPDGREIAFAWDGVDRKHYDIYVQLLGAELPLRLTYSKTGLLGPPAWSPDGREIAFSRCDGKNDGVYVVPALGGSERMLTTVGCIYTLPGPVAWLADGQKLLMVDRCTPSGPFDVVLFSLATGTKECVTKTGPQRTADGGFGFALSPDETKIAFIRTTASLVGDIYTVRLSDGKLQRLTTASKLGCTFLSKLGCTGVMWTPDSKYIVFLSAHTTLPSLWRVPVNGGPLERETTYPEIGAGSKDGSRFAYSETVAMEVAAIWRADLAAAGGHVLSNKKLISTQYPETDAQPSPDGTQLVWMSIRTGSEEIWSSSAAGEHPTQLTRLTQYCGTPRWSPDGKWIVFDSYTDRAAQVFIVDSEGRNLRAITHGPFDNVVPSWARDGRSIYFTSKRAGTWQVWKHSLDTGAEIQLTEHGGFDPNESYDGRTIYFSRFEQGGIWSLPASGGAESLVIPDKPQVGYWGHWAVTPAGLYLMDVDAEPRPTIEFYNFATRRIAPVLTLDERPARQQPALSVTADGKTLYYTQYDRQSVIKMIEFSH